MMRAGRYLAGAMVLAGLLFWGWTTFFPSEERVIRKRLADVAKHVSFAGGESPLAKMANVRKLAAYFTPDVQIIATPPGSRRIEIDGRDELIQGALEARSAFTALKLEFLDVSVEVESDSLSATVRLTAKAVIDGDEDFAVQEYQLWLKKNEGEWQVDRVEAVKTLL
jgi:hypothetical protein